ncbi:MAG: hypothetical protein ABIH11_01780 [Candidatus Altiarchaeota archaeon]
MNVRLRKTSQKTLVVIMVLILVTWALASTVSSKKGKSRPEKGRKKCSNGVDDDRDGLVDCKDPGCKNSMRGKEMRNKCSNGVDDDCDGLIDCADPNCKKSGSEKGKKCSNKADDDCDGLVDCKDPDCRGLRQCKSTTTTTTLPPKSSCRKVLPGSSCQRDLQAAQAACGLKNMVVDQVITVDCDAFRIGPEVCVTCKAPSPFTPCNQVLPGSSCQRDMQAAQSSCQLMNMVIDQTQQANCDRMNPGDELCVKCKSPSPAVKCSSVLQGSSCQRTLQAAQSSCQLQGKVVDQTVNANCDAFNPGDELCVTCKSQSPPVSCSNVLPGSSCQRDLQSAQAACQLRHKKIGQYVDANCDAFIAGDEICVLCV